MKLMPASTRVFRLFIGEEIMMLALFVLIKYQSVTGGWSDISAIATTALA